MNTRKLVMASAIAATLISVPFSQADTLEISVSKQSPELQSVSRPHTGMTKSSVEQIFGSPQTRGGPIGEPPISNWSYPQFTVYFESDTVLHSVLKTTPEADIAE